MSALIRQVTGSHRAYPLMDLAHLLLKREGCCFVKLALASEAGADVAFHICKLCGHTSMDATALRTHVMSAHFESCFVVEEVPVEPPSGNFVCVAKCGMSGEHLGPPNHHSYNERIREVHAARYANMSMEEYRSRIVLQHDAEAVEAWRESCSVQRRYRVRAAEGESVDESVEPLTWVAAQTHMRDVVVPGAVSTAKKAVMTEAVARTASDPGLRRAIREEWQSEMRFPVHLAFSLRAAFRHRRLHTFKAGKGNGVNFVTGVEPNPISPDHTIDMIRQVLTLLTETPGMSKAQVLEAVAPGAERDSAEEHEVRRSIHWLTEKGHIIEFFDGSLSVPLGKHAAGNAAPHLPGFKNRGKRAE